MEGDLSVGHTFDKGNNPYSIGTAFCIFLICRDCPYDLQQGQNEGTC